MKPGVVGGTFRTQIKPKEVDSDPREPRAHPQQEGADNERSDQDSFCKNAKKPDCRQKPPDKKAKHPDRPENEPKDGSQLVSEDVGGKRQYQRDQKEAPDDDPLGILLAPPRGIIYDIFYHCI